MTESKNKKDKPDKETILPTATSLTPDEKVVFAIPVPKITGYQILSTLGEGGCGIVYLADQREPVKRRVALKVIKPGMDSKQVIARFEAEEQALALLDHPNISRVFSAGATGASRPYFVMEYVKGVPITEHCDRHKLSIEDRLDLFLQVCDAIQHAHQKGIIHRDIKPSNILVSIEGDSAILKVIDFGVAKAISQPLTERTLFTEQGQLIGTPEYMSPEQAEMTAQNIDTRSDIYSLGILLYELLTGTLPFDKETLRKAAFGEIQRIIRQQDPPRPSTRLSSLGEEATTIAQSRRTEIGTLIKRLHKELEWIPLKAMRKEPNERYRSASEFADDIKNYLEGSPLIAGPESVGYQVKKFVKRNRVLVTSVIIVLVAVIAGAIVSTIFAIRESRARVIADKARIVAETAMASEARQRQIAETERDRSIKAQQETQQVNEKLRWENYTATLSIVEMLIKSGKLPRARTILESCPVELRGWEWGRLMRRISPELVLIRTEEFEDRPPGSLHNAIFTPDGRYILDDRPGFTTKSLIDLETGKTVLKTKPYQSGWRECTQFLPDPKKVSYSSGLHTVDIVDLWTDETIARFDSKGDTDTLRSFVISYNGKTAAGYIIDEDTGRREIILWDAVTARELKRFSLQPVDVSSLPRGMDWWGERLCAPLGRVLGFLPDNQHLAFVDEQLSIIDISSGKIEYLVPCHGWVAAYAPLSSIAACRNQSHQVELWDVTKKIKIAELEKPYPNILILGISADGKWVGTSGDGQWDLWRGGTGAHVRTYPDQVNSITFDPSGSFAITTDLKQIKIWSTLKERNTEMKLLVDTDDQTITWNRGVWKYDHSISRVASGDGQGNLALWNVPAFQLFKHWKAHDGWIYRIVFSPDDRFLASLAIKKDHSEIKIWETDSGNLVQTINSGLCQAFSSVAFSPDGRHLAVGFTLWREPGARIKTDGNGVWRQKRTGQDWELDNSSRWTQNAAGEWLDSYGIFQRNEEGELVEVPRWDNFRVQVFDVASGSILRTSPTDRIPISMISYDTTGKWLIVGRGWYGSGEEVKIFDAQTLHNVIAKIPDIWGCSVLFTSDGGHMLLLAATGSGHDPPYVIYSGGKIVLWSIEQRREVWRINNIDAHQVILHPDDHRYVTLSTNRKITVHAMRDGRELVNLEQEGSHNQPIAFTSDGRQLIILKDGGYIQTLHSDDWALPDKDAAFEAALCEVQQELNLTP
ncbi:MAG: protein kinase domain-containing protein [Planctomycetota bacterium]